jgi:hypothetical protein
MKTIMTTGKGGMGRNTLLANLLIHHSLPDLWKAIRHIQKPSDPVSRRKG